MKQDIKAQLRVDHTDRKEGQIVTYSEYCKMLVNRSVNEAHHDAYWEKLPKKLDLDIKYSTEESMQKFQDCIIGIEGDVGSVKQSFTSLRMEFKKLSKAQDFKNTTTSVFLLKAMDSKPDERKQLLSKLSEHEEKCRGAVQKAENDLKMDQLEKMSQEA